MTELFPVQGGYVEWDPISELRHLARSAPVILDGCPDGTPESATAALQAFGEAADGLPEELRERGRAVLDAFYGESMPWWLFCRLSERAFVRISALKKVLDGIPLNVGYDGPGPMLPSPITPGGIA